MPARSRYLAAGLLVAVSLGGTTAVSPFASGGSEDVAAEVALTFRDRSIDESSGLVVRGRTVLTVNDSGDGPYVYAVDGRTGETTGVTTFADEDPADVEALAPGRGGTVWVGDIGDNGRVRDSVTVHRVTPRVRGGRARATSFGLRYPDGPHDAETLLVHPRTGRVAVVTKRPFIGGVVYLAPRDLNPGAVHRLQRVASVPGTVTDGAFLLGGRHVVLRTYGAAAVYTYPGFAEVASFDLPAQEQGEAVAVGPDGRLYLSTEGELSDVVAVELPEEARSALRPRLESPTPSPTESGSPAPDARDDTARDQDTGAHDPGPRFWTLVLAGGGVGLLVGLAVRASRRRGRRTR